MACLAHLTQLDARTGCHDLGTGHVGADPEQTPHLVPCPAHESHRQRIPARGQRAVVREDGPRAGRGLEEPHLDLARPNPEPSGSGAQGCSKAWNPAGSAKGRDGAAAPRTETDDGRRCNVDGWRLKHERSALLRLKVGKRSKLEGQGNQSEEHEAERPDGDCPSAPLHPPRIPGASARRTFRLAARSHVHNASAPTPRR